MMIVVGSLTFPCAIHDEVAALKNQGLLQVDYGTIYVDPAYLWDGYTVSAKKNIVRNLHQYSKDHENYGVYKIKDMYTNELLGKYTMLGDVKIYK